MSTVANAPLVIDNIRPATPPLTPGQLPSARPAATETDLSFWDLLDVINPLQHLPIISTIYREITGDTIKPAMRVIGGALYGGAIGAGAAVVTELAEEAMGLGDGETMLALFKGDDAAADAATPVAQGPSASDRIARYATAGTAPAETQVAATVLPASAAPVAADPAPAATPAAAPAAAAGPAAAATPVSAGSDARMFPMAQASAGFMPIRQSDVRTPDLMPRMPVPEKRPLGLTPKAHDLRAVGMHPAPRPASAALLSEAPATAPAPAPDGADYIRVPSKAEMAAASARAEAAAAAAKPVSQQTADAAVLRALEAQGLQGEARNHPMLRTAATPRPVSDSAVTGATGYATAAESIAAAEAAAANAGQGDVQQVPGWFDQAMLKALDRYQQTGSLGTARPQTQGTGA